jgi:hypothetical protein
MKRSVVSAWIAAALVAAAAIAASARSLPAEPLPACAATTVRYGATTLGLPHVDAPGVVGNLFYYTGATLMDGRVNGSDGLVIYTGGRNGKLATKILWTIRKGAGRVLRISGRRLDGKGSFTERWPAVRGKNFPSIVRVPAAGCWRLSVASGRVRASVVVQAVEPPTTAFCDASPVYRRAPPHPRFGAITWMPATPRSAGVAAVLFVTVFPDQDNAMIPAGGRFPGGPSTKFLWWAPRPGASLTILARRLDAPGRFRARFNSATGDVGDRGNQTIFPSIIDVPRAGCWSLILRTGRSAGNVVFQVTPATAKSA